ncbi:NAD(P)H-dependent oxidoreductase, partial [Listeria monocytogenes]
MKRICIVFDHPYTGDASFNEPHNRSFSAALLLTAKETYEQAGYTVDIIDLHKDGFDPVMHKEDLIAWRKKEVDNPLVKNYQERIMTAEELLFIFPIWWEAMPAMM